MDQRRLLCICMCCGNILERTRDMKRYVQCLECQKKDRLELLELSLFKGKFEEMMIQEGRIKLSQ